MFNAHSLVIHNTNQSLGRAVVLVGGFFKPLGGFGVVGSDAKAFAVGDAEVGLRFGIAGIGGFFKPWNGFCVIFFDAEAFTVHVANVELGGHVAFFSGFFQERESILIVFRFIERHAFGGVLRTCENQSGRCDQDDQNQQGGVFAEPALRLFFFLHGFASVKIAERDFAVNSMMISGCGRNGKS